MFPAPDRVQQELAEASGVSPPTISRVVNRLAPLLGQVLEDYEPAVEGLETSSALLVVATVAPCWFSTEFRAFRVDILPLGAALQMAYDRAGRLARVLGPVGEGGATTYAPGCRVAKAPGPATGYQRRGLRRVRNAHPDQETHRWPTPGIREKVQHVRRPYSSDRRALNREPEDPARTAHRLSLTVPKVGRKHYRCHRPGFLSKNLIDLLWCSLHRIIRCLLAVRVYDQDSIDPGWTTAPGSMDVSPTNGRSPSSTKKAVPQCV